MMKNGMENDTGYRYLFVRKVLLRILSLVQKNVENFLLFNKLSVLQFMDNDKTVSVVCF